MTPFVRKKWNAVESGHREEALTIESEITETVAFAQLKRITGQTASSFLLFTSSYNGNHRFACTLSSQAMLVLLLRKKKSKIIKGFRVSLVIKLNKKIPIIFFHIL